MLLNSSPAPHPVLSRWGLALEQVPASFWEAVLGGFYPTVPDSCCPGTCRGLRTDKADTASAHNELPVVGGGEAWDRPDNQPATQLHD